jgi:hypothetical protein
MTQPVFAELNIDARRQKIRKRVRAVSVQQYAEGRERFTGRKADVLRWLAAYYNRFQSWPTAAELAAWDEESRGAGLLDWTAQVLHVRRGISDLQSAGLVEPNGRKRDLSGRRCETWRVVEVGRQ